LEVERDRAPSVEWDFEHVQRASPWPPLLGRADRMTARLIVLTFCLNQGWPGGGRRA
jgi:hypothetical protein